MKTYRTPAVAAPRQPAAFLRVRDVARMLNCSIPTVWRWARLGLLPKPVRLGQQLTAWSTADIDAWIATKVVAPTSTTTPTPPAAAAPARQRRKPSPSTAAVPVEDTAALCKEFA